MAICNIRNTTPSVEIEYLSGCSQKSDLPSFKLAPDLQTGYPLYTAEESGWHIIISQEAYNLVQNPVFFNDTEGWVEFNSLMSRSNVNSFDSGFSAFIRGSGDDVTAERRAYIETEAEGFAPGQAYVFSAYIWLPRLYDSQDPFLGTISIVDSDGTTDEEVFSEPITSFGKWVRVAVSKTIRTDATSVLLRVNLRSQNQRELAPPYALTGLFNLEEEYMFADMLQFEQGISPTTPFHGDAISCQGGECGDCCDDAYKWLGAAHSSISYRSKCARDGGILTSLHDIGFDILEHTGHGAPPVRDIYYDYNSRPGGKYQKTVVDTNVITLSGYICNKSLKELECDIFGLQDVVFPDISGCNRQMLLVYAHGDDCTKTDCDPERYLAYCVSYIGGLEGVRNNHFQQRLALQFRAHNPFPFEWPGQSAHELNLHTVGTGQSVAKIGLNEVRTYPEIQAADYNTLSCIGEQDKFLLGGNFEIGDAINVLVHDCEEICEHQLDHGEVTESVRDSAGNIIVGGSFLTPYQRLAIYYPDIDAWAGFGYTGGDVLDLAAPFWAEAVVGATDGVHIITASETFVFNTDGPVNAIAITTSGDLYAFGDFTTIGGVAATNVARMRITSNGVIDLGAAQWEALGFSLNGSVTTAHAFEDRIYIGGDFTLATPNSVSTCTVINGDKSESKGSAQIVNFYDDTPAVGQITIRFEVANIVARTMAELCLTSADPERMLRITATSTLGTVYNFIFPDDAILATDFTTNTNYNCERITTTINAIDLTTDDVTDTFVFVNPANATLLSDEIADALVIENQQIANGQPVTLFEVATDQGTFTFRPSALLTTVGGTLTFDDTLVTDWPFNGIINTGNAGTSYETLSNCNTIRYVAELTIDKTYVLAAGSCAQDNQELIDDIAEGIALAQVYAGLNYADGQGRDNTLNNVIFQCVQRVDGYQGDSTTINHVAVIDGGTLSQLGDGLSTAPNVLFVNPDTGEVLAGTDDGLYSWLGSEWLEYPAFFGSACGSGVIDLDYCDGSLYVLFDGSGASLLPGQTNINYLGGIDTYDFEIVLHGPGKIRSFSHCKKQMVFYSELQCGEVANFNFNNGSFVSGDRSLDGSILAGSRYDMALQTCENPIKLLVTDTDSSTRATILYRRQYIGIEALCCSKPSRDSATVTRDLGLDEIDPCCYQFFTEARNPELTDCVSEGYREGDMWYNAIGECYGGTGSGCPRLFINSDDECCDELEHEFNLIDANGNVILDVENGDPFCDEEP